MQSYMFLPIALIFTGLFIREEYIGNTKKNVILKASASVCFILVGFLGMWQAGLSLYSGFIITGLILGAAGDVFLAYKTYLPQYKDKFFLAGLASFLIGHLFYVFAFLSIAALPFWAFIIAAAIVVSAYSVTSKLGCRYEKMKLPVLLYMSVISVMVLAAIFAAIATVAVNGPLSILLILGSFLFMISDLILCFMYFNSAQRSWFCFVNLSTYYSAQLLFAMSLIF